MTQDNPLTDFAHHLGALLGLLHRPNFKAALVARGASEDQVAKLQEAIVPLARKLYSFPSKEELDG